ncbi:MAG: helix-turn-helix transcriptional regulator [Nostoc sp.]|uniref:helix-turn-helix transcriptional regulator n=1 Tax=Nostoc sp. TaxID=1180 RepID=UPI002FFB4430
MIKLRHKKAFHPVPSPLLYVQSLRLEQAKQLLRGTNLLIAEIAYQVGYESTSHFSYLFKRQFGMTPRKYRQPKGRG